MSTPEPTTPHSALRTIDEGEYGPYAPPRARARVGEVWAWLSAEFMPPDLGSKGRPSIADTWHYATHGSQAPSDGPARAAFRVWAWVVIPLRYGLGILDWILERPSRSVAAFGLWALLAHTPIGRFLPWF